MLRFTEKGNLEVLLFTIQSKMRANNQKVYMPREGKLISDINKVNSSLWSCLGPSCRVPVLLLVLLLGLDWLKGSVSACGIRGRCCSGIAEAQGILARAGLLEVWGEC